MRLTRMSIDELAMKLPTIDEKKQQEYVAGYASVSFDDYLWMVERGAWPGGYVTLPNGEVAWGLASVSVTGNYPTSTNGISDSIFTVDYSKLNDPNWTSISGMYYVYNGGGGGGGSYVPPSNSSTVSYATGIDSSMISELTLNILKNSQPNASLVITSTMRTPQKQAEVMYDNILKYGVQNEKNLYAAPGDRVIEVFDSTKSREVNINNMLTQIYKEGPTNVSKHCGDFNEINVIDVRMSSVPEKDSFLSNLQSNPYVIQVIQEDDRGVYHIVIKQK